MHQKIIKMEVIENNPLSISKRNNIETDQEQRKKKRSYLPTRASYVVSFGEEFQGHQALIHPVLQ